MKLFCLVLCFVAAAFAEDTYGEDFDIDEVLNNERLLNSYARCLIDKGPCTPDIKKVKEKLPEILETQCAKCTEKQKQAGKTLARKVKTTRPDLWKELVAHYDPNGKYQKSFQKFLE